MKKIIVIGKNGQLGQSIASIASKFPYEFQFLSSAYLDVSNETQVQDVLGSIDFDLLINASAYTAVDQAETEREKAFDINESGVRKLGEVCADKGAGCFHVSTDYVFDGSKEEYFEEDETNPLGVYGASKLAGEKALLAVNDRALIIRTAWVFSEFKNNFLKTMLRLGKERDELGIVSDQHGGPTSSVHLAQVLLGLAEKSLSGVDVSGIFHFSGQPFCTWYDFAEDIFSQAKEMQLIDRIPKLNKLSTSDYPTPAKRPQSSCLNSTKLSGVLGDLDQDWRQEVSRVLTVLKEEDK
ncbi:MAG: dTDP-4-dehydrorhamnose reductase [Lentisphaeraceae bacterium]|nr:dTDP-4-dehydrorhamnose reductase [Lentisphaeraceae bacterium]